MALVTNSFSSVGTTDLKLSVTTGTSAQLTFTAEVGDVATLLAAADAAADAAILEYTGVPQQGDGSGAAGSADAAAIPADTTMAGTLQTAITAATAAGLTTLAATLGATPADDTDNAEAKAALDAAIASGGAIFDAIAVAKFEAAHLEDGNYRLAYSDAVGAVSYNSANSVQVIQFTMANGAMVGTNNKLTVTSNKVHAATGVTAVAATKITGVLTLGAAATVNGKGYGIQLTKITSGVLGFVASVGTGLGLARVIVNGGPNKLDDDFRVSLTAVPGQANKAKILFKLAGSSKANHSTGKHTDLKYLRFMWADAVSCVFKTVDIDLRAATAYDGENTLLVSREHDFESPVNTTLFEYSAALVDITGAVSEYASTAYASSVADNATNVQDLVISGDSAAGTKITVQWKAPDFTARTIDGYEIITQKLATGSADLASSTLAVNGVTPFICNMAHTSNTATKVGTGSTETLKYQLLSNGTYSPDTYEQVISGLEARTKYAVWVRAYHPDDTTVQPPVKVYGAIGADLMNAPSYVWDTDESTQTLDFDSALHSWAGSYIETAVGATPLDANAAPALFEKPSSVFSGDALKMGYMTTLTGAPSNFLTGTSITMQTGITVQANVLDADNAGTPTSAAVRPEVSESGDDLMEKSIAIKWSDAGISDQGMSTNFKMQYICMTEAHYQDLNDLGTDQVYSFYSGTLEKTAATADGQTPAVMYPPGWTDLNIASLGQGEVTNATYNVMATDNTERYCRFATGVSTDTQGALAEFNTDGSLKINALEATAGVHLTTIALNADETGLDTTTDSDKGIKLETGVGTLSLGETYRFILRLSNDNGANTPKVMSPKTVTGRASAVEFLKEGADASGDFIGPTSLMWDPSAGRFEFKITDTYDAGTIATDDDETLVAPTGAKPTDMTYQAVIVSTDQNDAASAALGDPGTRRPTHSFTTTPISCNATKDGNLTTVTFDNVYAKEISYYAGVTTSSGTTYANPVTAPSAIYTPLTDFYGWRFEIKLIAKNGNGARTVVGTDHGAKTFGTKRQVFASEATFEAVATTAGKVSPKTYVQNAGQSTETITTYKDVRLKNIATFGTPQSAPTSAVSTNVYFLSASIKDISATDFATVGRRVDKIEYEVYQNLGDNNRHRVGNVEIVSPDARIVPTTDISGVTTEAPSNSTDDESKGYDLAYEKPLATWDGSAAGAYSASESDLMLDNGTASNDIVKDRFNIWVHQDDVVYGYPLRLAVRLLSDGADDLAQSPAKSTLALSAKEYYTEVTTFPYATIPFEDHDECAHFSATAGDEKMTLYWTEPNINATELQGATASDTPSLEGYQIELYDIISRSPDKDSNGVKRFWKFETETGAGNQNDRVEASATPVQTIIMGKEAKTKEITGLKNGKHYVPIIKTLTRQGTNDVLSVGRTIFGTIGTDGQDDEEFVARKVIYVDDEAVAYTAATWRQVQNTTTNKTGVVLNSSATNPTIVVPFGTPFIEVDLSATPKTLKVDDNGSDLLFGAMLQTAPGGNNATPSAGSATQIGTNTSSANLDNVFYLDLSFGAAPSAGRFTGDNAPTTYKSPAGAADAGVAYPARAVTNVNTAYLGSNWALETNYIFASNAAGTTVGKVTSSGLASA